MKTLFVKFGYTVASLSTGVLLTACNGVISEGEGESEAETAATSVASVRLALISVPANVSCVRAKVKTSSQLVTRDVNLTPGAPSVFDLSGLPSGQVTFDMDAFSAPCAKLGKDSVPTWVADTQTVVLTTGTSTPISATLRKSTSASAVVTADFVDGTDVPPPPPPNGLVGHWSFNAVSGSSVPDDSGNGNVGQIVQGTTQNAPLVSGVIVPGKVGPALDLSPANTWVRVKDSESINSTGTTGQFTLASWVKPGAVNQRSQWAIARQEVGTSIQHFGLGMRDGAPFAAVHFFFTTSTQNLAPGQWTHLASTYDGITQTLFVNGAQAGSQDIGWSIAADTTNTVIGAAELESGVKEFFAGTLDEVRLYNVSLSAAEVAQLPTAK